MIRTPNIQYLCTYLYSRLVFPRLSPLRLYTVSLVRSPESVEVSARLIGSRLKFWTDASSEVSEQRLIKWFGKPCPKIRARITFKLGPAMSISLPTSFDFTKLAFPTFIVLIVNPTNMQLGNFRRHYKCPPLIASLWEVQYYKGNNCRFHDTGPQPGIRNGGCRIVGRGVWGPLKAQRGCTCTFGTPPPPATALPINTPRLFLLFQ